MRYSVFGMQYMENKKIKTFKDLFAWQEAHALALMVYKLTDTFPQKEIFGLVSQMRRCAVSISSNIAEGFGRTTSKDKAQFYSISYGSLNELSSQLLIAHDVGLVSSRIYQVTDEQINTVGRLLNGLKKIKYA